MLYEIFCDISIIINNLQNNIILPALFCFILFYLFYYLTPDLLSNKTFVILLKLDCSSDKQRIRYIIYRDIVKLDTIQQNI